MELLDDIGHLEKYGTEYTRAEYTNQTRWDFYNAERVWQGMLDTLHERLRDAHRIDSPESTLGNSDTFLLYFRAAYLDLLTRRPLDIEECKAVIEDIQVTLQTAKSLDAIVPYKRRKPDSGRSEADQFDMRSMAMKHLEGPARTVVDVEERTIQNWNQRTGTSMQPWNREVFQDLIERSEQDRDTLLLRRAYVNGTGDTLGYYGLRKEKHGWDLVAYGCVGTPDVAEKLVSHMVLDMHSKGRRRIANLLASTHAK